jgi:seryl-tRNA synthetase
MLDLNFIREHSDQVRQACIDKQLDPKVVDDLLALDRKRRDLISQVDQVRAESNQVADEVKKLVASGQGVTPELGAKGKEAKVKLKDLEPNLRILEQQFKAKLLEIPNIPAGDVPVGKDELDNKVIRTEGTLPKFDFEPLPHHELMEQLGWLDTKRAVKIGGFRTYFLKNKAVFLEQAIHRLALDLMVKHGFEPMTIPTMVNRKALVGTGFFPWGEQDHYYTQDEKFLTGTGEVGLTSYYGDEVLNEKDLPKKLVGYSTCFRREIGTHGKDTQGIVRVHQFNKTEQVVLTVADEEETRVWHEKILKFSEELLKSLGLPYQVVLMCTGDMGAGQRKKFDIETWFPTQNKYRETNSCSYFNDFQSRRLNIKYNAKDGTKKFVYTLNNTVAATPRLLAALVENHQQADGSVKIPEVLEKYLV